MISMWQHIVNNSMVGSVVWNKLHEYCNEEHEIHMYIVARGGAEYYLTILTTLHSCAIHANAYS